MNCTILFVPWLLVASLVLGLVPGSATAQITFTSLGDLPGGQTRSEALGVSANGLVVVGASSSTLSMQRIEAHRWTAEGGMVGLGALPGPMPASAAFGASSDGDVVVGSTTDSSFGQAFRWTVAGGMMGLGFLPGGTPGSRAWSTSADGSVVVGESGQVPKAFRWTAADGMVPLGGPPGEFVVYSIAHDVSADGAVIAGTIQTPSSEQAFRWTAESGVVRLGAFGRSGASGVSADGSVVVGWRQSGDGNQAFRWTEASGMVGLGDLPGGAFSSGAHDVSANGSVIVGVGETDRGEEAMFWTQPTGMVNLREFLTSQGLDLAGWNLTSAEGVSADGRTVVGTGLNPAGISEGWVATIPEPSTIVLAALAALALCALYLRQRLAVATAARR